MAGCDVSFAAMDTFVSPTEWTEPGFDGANQLEEEATLPFAGMAAGRTTETDGGEGFIGVARRAHVRTWVRGERRGQSLLALRHRYRVVG